ncbi:MAG: hypothetical protein WKF77_24050, partial [Planctomycetaceae bacterium]
YWYLTPFPSPRCHNPPVFASPHSNEGISVGVGDVAPPTRTPVHARAKTPPPHGFQNSPVIALPHWIQGISVGGATEQRVFFAIARSTNFWTIPGLFEFVIIRAHSVLIPSENIRARS